MIEAVASRLEGAPREVRRWSDEFKAQAVVEAMQPGTNISAVARRIGIDPSQLFTWLRHARRKAAVLPTTASGNVLPSQATSRCPTIEIIIGDTVIRAGADIDEAHLARVLRAVRSA
ncbi:transposase [Sinorhizobium meliloti]|uniref:transposase n=1 Tax=Rhizobium meliloti TaxID=382 RepID=UPI001F1E56B3|nr:transposase [Sinorhizobium meliloti]WQO37344.1 transposase [Sinorhizobium meliloti]WQO77819.1 transposase [Sinorhizobium meliloti]WQP22596.1 transposase [Sinorhizobium meliloti]